MEDEKRKAEIKKSEKKADKEAELKKKEDDEKEK